MSRAVQTFLSACVLLCPGAAVAQETPALVSLERPGDGAPVCGLGKAFHAGRRAALRAELESGVLICLGLPEERGYTRFSQDKVFWYLTGVESPNAALLMDLDSGQEVLFLPAADPGKEAWDGEIWDPEDEWVRGLSGFEQVLDRERFVDEIRAAVGDERTVWISTHPNLALSGGYDRAGPFDEHQKKDPLDGRVSREQALKDRLAEMLGQAIPIRSFTRKLSFLRRIKTTEEIAAMGRAARAGARAMIEAMRSTSAGVGEWELAAVMSMQHVLEGAAGPAYLPIVGSGANSCVLHYGANSRRMRSGEVVLIDYGPELDHYTSDITRTWPVDGTFSERQAELYDAVLEAQKAAIAVAKPGATLRDCSRAARAVLDQHEVGHLMFHGLSHMIGLEVHDVGGFGQKLEVGMVFTIEPGVYERSTGIGIRIEDVIVITADGCEVISSEVPKERAEIEALVREEGLLDRHPIRD